MSRCFPYPPPGYTPSRASKEALIESIKLQKEQAKAKAQKKREKEYERKEREDERNEIRKKTNEKTDLNSKKRRKREEGREEKKGRRKENIEKPDVNSNKFNFPNGQIGKNIWAHGEQLERSGLTEEHDQPIRLHLPSKSSESTENSSKRKRPSSPVNVIRGHGTLIRIQLSSKKQNLSDISINEQQLCSTSGRTDVPPLRNWQPNFCASTEKASNWQPNFCASTEKASNFVRGDFNRIDKKQIVSTSGKSEPASPAKTRTSPGLDAIEGSKKSSESVQYKNLIENCVPPSLQDTPFSPEDLDWLICSKDHGLRPERRQNFENYSGCYSRSSLLWQPRAQLLPEIDVYALPFTVPY